MPRARVSESAPAVMGRRKTQYRRPLSYHHDAVSPWLIDRFTSRSAASVGNPESVTCKVTTSPSGLASTKRSLPASFQYVVEASWIVGAWPVVIRLFNGGKSA